MQFQSYQNALSTKRAVDKSQFKGYITDLINSSLNPSPSPQAFLVEQNPNWTLPTHFHFQDQFQLVVQGEGTIGRHSLRKLSIHYASEHSGYGPIKSLANGLSYFTIRSIGDTGAWYLPESYGELRKGITKIQLHGESIDAATIDELKVLNQAQLHTVINEQSDGVAAWIFKAPPNWVGEIENIPKSRGARFFVVTQGHLIQQKNLLGIHSVLQTNPGEKLSIASGEEGLELVILQFKNNLI
jgi:hypothetical protein